MDPRSIFHEPLVVKTGRPIILITKVMISFSHISYLSDDQKHIVLGSKEGAVYFLERDSGEIVATFPGAHSSMVTGVCSPEGEEWLLTSSDDGTILRWDRSQEEGYQSTMFHHSEFSVESVMANENGTILYLGTDEMSGLIRLDMESGQSFPLQREKSFPARFVRWYDSGIISATSSGDVDFWKDDGSPYTSSSASPHETGISGMHVFSKRASAVTLDESSIVFWSLKDRSVSGTLQANFSLGLGCDDEHVYAVVANRVIVRLPLDSDIWIRKAEEIIR